MTLDAPDPVAFDPTPGEVERLEPGLRRVLAPNPSPMTFRGTNTYLLGDGAVTVIDPGPDSVAHLDVLTAALEPGERVSQILVTHAHRDHAGLARALAETTQAPVLAFGDALAGRSAAMQALAVAGEIGGGEGVEAGFAPDRTLGDGTELEAGGAPLTALWTPGHMGNHLSFAWRGALFSGDLVMGWASTLISPPDGDLDDFLTSCARLRATAPRRLYPGHGAPVEDAVARIDALVAHREARERQILTALDAGAATPQELTRTIYPELAPLLQAAAMRNVLAHLVALVTRGAVAADPALGIAARYTLSSVEKASKSAGRS